MARLLGIDPGLRFTGWGVIEADGNRLRHVADGVIATDSATVVPELLKVLHDAGLVERERRGSWVFYRVVPEALATLRDVLG